MGLAETAAAFAREILAPGGVYLAKVLQGGTESAGPPSIPVSRPGAEGSRKSRVTKSTPGIGSISRRSDHLRIMGLAETAAAFAREILAPGGVYLAKVLQGGTER
jgi:23S rRNA U2552 (ribose-2'-O)-methylase RlmE/FtsJ